MKRPRPYIPIPVRLKVAERQVRRLGKSVDFFATTRSIRLKMLLIVLFNGSTAHLDHDPPLRARKFNPRTGRYTPDANDPDHLVYRTAEGHRLKTNVRGDGAQFPDRVLIKRERKLERKRAGKSRVKAKIPSRPFQKRKKTHWPRSSFSKRSKAAFTARTKSRGS